MPDIKIKRYADKENLKKLVKYSKDTFATKSETNEKFYTKEQVDTMLEGVSGGGGTVDLTNYYTKTEVDNLLSNIGGGDSATNTELDELTTEWSFE